MKAIIRMFVPDPKNPQVVGVVSLSDDGTAIVETQDEAIKRHLEAGVVGPMRKRLSTTMGREFIEAMPVVFKSAYIRAEVVQA